MLKRLILELLGVFIGIVILFLILSAVMSAVAKAGTERVDLSPIIKVIVFSTPEPNKWSSRIVKVHGFSDGIIVACFEWKNSVVAECLVVVNDGETLMVPVRMLEEKT